jgi:hypothetical protein
MAQKLVQKEKVKNVSTKTKKVIVCKERAVYCSQIGCGHSYKYHSYDGCRFVTEGTECEDRWRCTCECIQCIHKNELELKELQIQLDIDGQT